MSGIYEDYLDITNRAENNDSSNLNAIHLLDDDEFTLFFHSNPASNSIIHNIIHKNKSSNNTTTTSMPSPKTHIRKISHHAEDQEDDNSNHSQINNEDEEDELCGNGSEADVASNNTSNSSGSGSHHVKHVSYVHTGNSPTSNQQQQHMRSRSGMVYSPISTPKSLSSSSTNNTTNGQQQRKYNQSKASASIPSFALPHAPTQSFEEDDRDNKGQYYDSSANFASTTVTATNGARKIVLYSTLDGSPVYEPPLDTRTTNIEHKDLSELDVLCGRGGGTNSWIGNRRYRAVVQSYQPTYLKAKRKEKPMLAREIVCVIRSQGGRFLKKCNGNSTAYEDIGDHKAEAKTAQALREGLDVRATNAAASNLLFPKSSAGGGKKLLSPRTRSGPNMQQGRRKNIIYSSSIHPGSVCFVPHVGPSLPILTPSAAPVHAPATPTTVKRTRFEDDCENNVSAAASADDGDNNAFVPPLSPATKRMRAEQRYDANECGYDDNRDDDYPPQQQYQHQYQYPQQQHNSYYPSQSTQYYHQGGGYYYGAHQQQQPRFTPGQFEYWSPRSWDQEEEDHDEEDEDGVQV